MHGCANKERQDMKQNVLLKMQMILNGKVNAEYQDIEQVVLLKNVDHSERTSQQRESKDEATRDSEDSADAERSIYFWSSKHCGDTNTSI